MIVREASRDDLPAIRAIYNQGIEDRVATLDEELKSGEDIATWFDAHDERYVVLVAQTDASIAGWASLNRYSHRCAYDGVADLSIYVERAWRGRGVGTVLLAALETAAARRAFHKIVLFTFAFNELGRGLYRKCGFREVGIFREQGKLDGRYVDVLAMEKLLAD